MVQKEGIPFKRERRERERVNKSMFMNSENYEILWIFTIQTFFETEPISEISCLSNVTSPDILTRL